MKNKKSEIMIEQLIVFAIVVIVFVVVIGIYLNQFSKGGKETSDLVASTGHFDGDGIANYFDKCPCKDGNDDNEGCPKEIYEDPIKLEQEQVRCRALMNNERKAST